MRIALFRLAPLSLAFAPLLSAACQRAPVERASPASGGPSVGHASSSSASAPSAPPSARAPDRVDAAPPLVLSDKLGAAPNLLDLVPAKVAVSSAVVNPRDFPEFLVDGKVETAWNSKTGDLVGGFIAFRVPSDVRIRRLELTAGYDRIKGAVDLFTANHRVTRVQVSRDGATLGEFALDPAVRGLQAIPIDGPGGTYQVKVLATTPGTRKDWKELAVSEFRVVGTPGAEARDRDRPLRVVVGDLDAEPEGVVDWKTEHTHAFPSVAALCADVLKAAEAAKGETEETARQHGVKLTPPSCAELPSPVAAAFVGDATYKRARMVSISSGLDSTVNLALEVPRGLVLTSIRWWTHDPLDPGCPSLVRLDGVDALRIENGHVVAVLSANRGTFAGDGLFRLLHERSASWCTEAGGKLVCTHYDVQRRPLLKRFAITPGGTLVPQGDAPPER